MFKFFFCCCIFCSFLCIRAKRICGKDEVDGVTDFSCRINLLTFMYAQKCFYTFPWYIFKYADRDIHCVYGLALFLISLQIRGIFYCCGEKTCMLKVAATTEYSNRLACIIMQRKYPWKQSWTYGSSHDLKSPLKSQVHDLRPELGTWTGT